VTLFGWPLEFFLFGLTLVGVALAHRSALWISLAGLGVILAYKFLVAGFAGGSGLQGFGLYLAHEWVLLANLFLLLLGFAVLANQFELSNAPEAVPSLLPRNWTGGLCLLGIIFILSIFLDNIAGAVVGGVVARHVYRGRVHIGFLAAIVAAANTGGAGSVIGDTTTTMIWIAGVSPWVLLPAYIGAGAAFVVFGIPAALQQHRYFPVQPHEGAPLPIQWARLGVVVVMLLALLLTNISVSGFAPELEHMLPALGLGLWAAILLTALVRKPDWSVLPPAASGAVFLLALVAAAGLMPVDSLPTPSWQSTFGLGAVAAVFDNIPLTALALEQGGYDWALLAYAVGVGGSTIWFGSSAGVALTNLFPEGRSVGRWVKDGWHVIVAYVLGFFFMLAIHGWTTAMQ
jgi:Na+/H+ antiporter NhaD/arsenite permease-like protein